MIFEKLAALIAEQFNVDADSITMETSFTDDLNADSVDRSRRAARLGRAIRALHRSTSCQMAWGLQTAPRTTQPKKTARYRSVSPRGILALEEEFGIEELDEEEASSISTVSDLVRFLQNKID